MQHDFKMGFFCTFWVWEIPLKFFLVKPYQATHNLNGLRKRRCMVKTTTFYLHPEANGAYLKFDLDCWAKFRESL